MDNRQEKEQERRELRRKRRVRNQVIAYVTVTLLFIGVVVGGVFTGKYFLDRSKAKKEAEEALKQIEEIDVSENEIVISEPEPVEIEMTREEKIDEIVNAAIEVMPIEDKVAGLFLVTPEAITGVGTAVQAGEGTKEALGQYAIGGLIYFDKNIQSQDQLTEMIDNSVMYSKYPLFIGVDEEGGSVSRVAKSSIEVAKVEPAADIAASGDTAEAYNAGTTIGSYLNTLGFNLDFAPVADVAAGENSILGDRSYGSDPAAVAGLASNMVKGLQDSGISACMKHFPGLGDTTEDTHDGMASTERTADDFRSSDFLVYQAGIEAGVDFIMISHLSAPALTGDNTPCSLSSQVVTDLLRNELGYDGVIITDAMNMAAVTEYYTADEAAVYALRAGCDMILMPEDFETAYQGVLQAIQAGTISEERINDALRRIYRIKLGDTIDAQIGE